MKKRFINHNCYKYYLTQFVHINTDNMELSMVEIYCAILRTNQKFLKNDRKNIYFYFTARRSKFHLSQRRKQSINHHVRFI